MSVKDFLAEERAQGEWSTIYMLLVLVIVALLLISVVKPMFKQSEKVVATTKGQLAGE